MGREDVSSIVEALMNTKSLGARPFNPLKDSPVDMGFGGPSTELLQTISSPYDEYVNIPSLWFSALGNPVLLDDASPIAAGYEASTGREFPTYDTLDEAIFAAQMRSAAGGAEQRSLTDHNATIFQRPRIFGQLY